ncbi:MAG TPA: hypothetical protein VFQ85_01445 [Mycobacteriales bacterium]|nr:hypothetical protein [Mycobacteriales bacterium]
MRDAARVLAGLIAVAVLARDTAVAGGGAAITTGTYVCAFVVLAALTLWRDGFVTTSALALAAHYGLALIYGDVLADYGAPAVAALVVAYLDLADLATSLPRDHRVDRAFALARLRHLGLVLALGATASAAALAVASVRWPSAGAVRLLGAAAVALAVAAPVLVLRRGNRVARRQ